MDTNLSNTNSNNPAHWDLMIYRVPTEPASKRVSIWRELKRIGSLSLQQCVVILPHTLELSEEIDSVKQKITEMGGEVMHIPVAALAPEDEERTIRAFRDLRNKEYQEIIEECESHFVREVDFERFRKNYTYEAVEEAEQNLEKIRRWYTKIIERDWFHADLQSTANQRIQECQKILEIFEQDVYNQDEKESQELNTPAENPDAAALNLTP
jgi:hypothetical protein